MKFGISLSMHDLVTPCWDFDSGLWVNWSRKNFKLIRSGFRSYSHCSLTHTHTHPPTFPSARISWNSDPSSKISWNSCPSSRISWNSHLRREVVDNQEKGVDISEEEFHLNEEEIRTCKAVNAHVMATDWTKQVQLFLRIVRLRVSHFEILKWLEIHIDDEIRVNTKKDKKVQLENLHEWRET